ncbi:hypothetical protein BST33_01610 [Mycolicibacter minnesotensis]|uniref:Uncharacterized protein n=1 Tax=Mycolicibacter minnesotensis TaxID=1118379 RepID=A0A7I7RAW9_9MYCO|nr:hypothetical protein [Mycolicibacter minnesotensis]ORB04596.1 hypothetical protein BST33_01610 [Mycolicibacter minnesotensis]BBY35220.1 hypothetical protein MMIN_32810 [Mycolicibacter minnesotensis]
MSIAPTTDAPTVDDAVAEAVDLGVAAVEPDRRPTLLRLVFVCLLSALVAVLGAAAGYLRWQDISAQVRQQAAAESVQAATEAAIAMLTYRPDNVDTALAAAADAMTGSFRDEYTHLVGSVVAPGAKQQQISTVVRVPAAASVSANSRHAVVLLFVDQATTSGKGPATDTASSVRVSLDKVGGRWLVSQFDPV